MADPWSPPFLTPHPWIVLAAAMVEGAVGYPHRLHARLPHPVAWIGGLIGGLEGRLNSPRFGEAARRVLGVLTLLIVVGLAVAAGMAVEALARVLPGGVLLIVLAGALGLAARSLWDHVQAVAARLQAADLAGAREAVGRIVGRDTADLTPDEVAAAALESLAESLSDGVVAPLFWFLVAGLPGLFAYKAINTADSMIGHREPRWRAFGWAAARTDDLVNLIPARLSGGLIALAGGGGWRIMLRDAPRHASPNAGWPEAAMAGALAVRLGGPATYDGELAERPVFGEGPPPSSQDLARGLRLYERVLGLLALALALGGLLWPL
ncbi:adenosylcobinamide-phosphate synthase CbiB [Phenylobacterium sp.]|uniref:adenosylcobinamide-phosphate synthase CbiB n=1 Tax=Phenylobacterium sp. TaxID=1871053 RepID=UPI002FD94635